MNNTILPEGADKTCMYCGNSEASSFSFDWVIYKNGTKHWHQTCLSCNRGLKSVRYKTWETAVLYVGKYKNILIITISDRKYLWWALNNMTDLKPHQIEAIKRNLGIWDN